MWGKVSQSCSDSTLPAGGWSSQGFSHSPWLCKNGSGFVCDL